MSRLDHPWRSRFYYGTGGSITDWETTLPAMPWIFDTDTVGGARIAASGTPAGYVIRRDYKLELTLRLFESEFLSLEHMVRWGQTQETMLWYPDANLTDTYFTVYLDSPPPGQSWRSDRDPEYQKAMQVPIVLRNAAYAPFSIDYFV